MNVTINKKSIFESDFYKDTNKKKTASDFYIERGACHRIISLVTMNNKTYGAFCERLVRDFFKLDPPMDTQHDAIFLERRIEIKSPRMGASGNYFIQHIKKTHNFEFILINLLESKGFKTMILSKKEALPHLKLQKGEGYFLHQKEIDKISKVVKNKKDLRDYVLKYRRRSWILDDDD